MPCPSLSPRPGGPGLRGPHGPGCWCPAAQILGGVRRFELWSLETERAPDRLSLQGQGVEGTALEASRRAAGSRVSLQGEGGPQCGRTPLGILTSKEQHAMSNSGHRGQIRRCVGCRVGRAGPGAPTGARLTKEGRATARGQGQVGVRAGRGGAPGCAALPHPPLDQHSRGHRLLYPHCVSLCLWLICFPSGWGPHCPAPFLAECGGPVGLGHLPQVFSQTAVSAPVPRAFLVSPRRP